MHQRPPGSALPRAYVLLLASGLYLWPVTLGMPPGPLRLTWIGGSFALLLFSAWIAHRTLGHAPLAGNFERMPRVATCCLLAVLAIPLIRIPVHSFSDEPLIAAPALTVVSRIAMHTGWWPLPLFACAALMVAFVVCVRLSIGWSIVAAALFAAIGAGVSLLVHDHSVLAVRYPPMVHLLQVLAAIAGDGSFRLLRLPNLVWVLGLMLTAWQLTPGYSSLQRWALVLALLLGPMGWVYHLSL